MSDFCFYMGDNLDFAKSIRFQAESVWGEVDETVWDSFRLFIPSTDYFRSFAESNTALGAVSGFVRCDQVVERQDERESLDARHNRRFIDDIIDDDKWPLGPHWTGSFCSVSYSKRDRDVVICNDAVGYIPVYFYAGDKGILGGTSLIVLGRSIGCDPDLAGILEHITIPYCNYGRRTLLKQVSRLLPGERAKLSHGRSRAISSFDNSLCNGVIDSPIDEVARTVWDSLQSETNLALGGSNRVCVALSGGWDSRLALGTVSHRPDSVLCYTFGNRALHEVRTARQCALAVGAQHECFPIENAYFPSRTTLESLVLKTEAANHLQWCPLIEGIKANDQRDVILLGDLCESIVALNMKQFSTRDARVRSFAKGLIGGRERIPLATARDFSLWKEKMGARLLSSILSNIDKLSPELSANCNEAQIADEIASDLDLCFSRVRDNEPVFAPMYDELFYWFHRARFLIAGQALLLNSKFRPLCPAVSLRFMRLISQVHPRMRIRRRLMNAIARLPEFDLLAKIPSAQIPWLSARTPALLREIVWGARSSLDQALIRRAMKNRDSKMRQRVLPTLDYMIEYQRADAASNVQSWFSGDWLTGSNYVEVVNRRASLAAWPLMNLDIAAPANVSIILDLCQGSQRFHRSASLKTAVQVV